MTGEELVVQFIKDKLGIADDLKQRVSIPIVKLLGEVGDEEIAALEVELCDVYAEIAHRGGIQAVGGIIEGFHYSIYRDLMLDAAQKVLDKRQ